MLRLHHFSHERNLAIDILNLDLDLSLPAVTDNRELHGISDPCLFEFAC